jgi:malonyl-CoA/methylmalonyl-CoA synthetase
MQLTDLYDISLIGRANTTALEQEDANGSITALTFGELELRSNRVAHVLAERGLEPGDRLALFLPNCIEFIDTFIACVKLGVIVVPINVLYREREIAHILSDAEPKAIVTVPDLAPFLPEGLPSWNATELSAAASGASAERIHRPLDGDSPAAIVYTSGTTGRSKGAILTHNNFASNAVNITACWRISEADRYLAVLPLFHVHGLGNGVQAWLLSGCRMRLTERFELTRAADWFESFQPTLFFGVPTIYVRLLELPDSVATRIGQFVRLFVSGSAPLPAQVLDEFRARFGHTILERYGMTETLMNISNPYTGERRAGSVGLPLPGVSVRIVNDELHVRGPNVCPGYWRREDATAEAFVVDDAGNRWFRTGDLGERSSDGYYTLRGRRSDLIISGGFNIYPREIEEVLLEQPGILEAAVCGMPDARRGEVPVAYVVVNSPDGELDVSALEEVCRRTLASFKIPRAFVRVDALPRNALGKVQKHLLPALPTT